MCVCFRTSVFLFSIAFYEKKKRVEESERTTGKKRFPTTRGDLKKKRRGVPVRERNLSLSLSLSTTSSLVCASRAREVMVPLSLFAAENDDDEGRFALLFSSFFFVPFFSLNGNFFFSIELSLTKNTNADIFFKYAHAGTHMLQSN